MTHLTSLLYTVHLHSLHFFYYPSHNNHKKLSLIAILYYLHMSKLPLVLTHMSIFTQPRFVNDKFIETSETTLCSNMTLGQEDHTDSDMLYDEVHMPVQKKQQSINTSLNSTNVLSLMKQNGRDMTIKQYFLLHSM